MNGTVMPTRLPEVLVITPPIYQDYRGYFFESFHQDSFTKITGVKACFVQDNQSLSSRHVLRGLHFQNKHPQGKLVRVIFGKIFDVAVDLRFSSPTFGQWVGVLLSSCQQQQLWIPPGFAHGFMVLSRHALCLYKTTAYWDPEDQHCIIWSDPDINIAWPPHRPLLSLQDQCGLTLQAWMKQYG